MPYALQKWDVIRVYRKDLSQPHDKFCICICPKNEWFLYINSEPPAFKKRRQFALDVANHEVMCLSKPVSYIDTAAIIDDLPPEGLAEAMSNTNRQHGPLMPSLRDKIKSLIQQHGAFSSEQMAIIFSE